MAGNYYEIESLVLERVRGGLNRGEDPVVLYQAAQEELLQANQDLHRGPYGIGPLADPCRGLRNFMRSEGQAQIVEPGGGPAADWGP